MPKRLKDVIEAVRQDMIVEGREVDSIDEAMEQDDLFYYNALPKMPQGVRESISAVGPHLAMPVIFAIAPAIGMLATGVRIDIHGKPSQLNLISYIAGDYASGKGSIDPVVAAWLSEVKLLDKSYLEAEEEWRAQKRAAKNKKEQPEDPKYPVRCLTLNNTVANLADRLANTRASTPSPSRPRPTPWRRSGARRCATSPSCCARPTMARPTTARRNRRTPSTST